MNNIFDFATSELSQDAMICWMCNNINYEDENRELYQLAQELIQRFLEIDERIQSLKVVRQFLKIDVLLLVNEKYAIIVEDKVYTTAHQNQESLYRQQLETSIGKGELKFDGKTYDIAVENIRTVYYKTGFHYDYDKRIKSDKIADVVLDLEQVIGILSKYENEANSELLTMYLEKLRVEQKWYETVQTKYEENLFDEVLKCQYGQYLLAKDLFGSEAELTHGSSSGTPWTQFTMVKDVSYFRDNTYRVFARIDSDTSGYKVSIRQYDRNPNVKDKNDDVRENKIDAFNQLWYAFEEAANQSPLHVVMGGNNGGYFESEIAKVYLTGAKATDLRDLKVEFPKVIQSFLEKQSKV